MAEHRSSTCAPETRHDGDGNRTPWAGGASNTGILHVHHAPAGMPVARIAGRYRDTHGARVFPKFFHRKRDAYAWYLDSDESLCAPLFAHELGGGGGAQGFFARPYDSLLGALPTEPPERRCLHELMVPVAPVKLFFDVDIDDRAANEPHIALVPSCVRLVRHLFDFVRHEFRDALRDAPAALRDAVDALHPARNATYLTGSRRGKLSMHIIIDELLVARTQQDLAAFMDLFMLYARTRELGHLGAYVRQRRRRAAADEIEPATPCASLDYPPLLATDPTRRVSLFHLETREIAVCTNPVRRQSPPPPPPPPPQQQQHGPRRRTLNSLAVQPPQPPPPSPPPLSSSAHAVAVFGDMVDTSVHTRTFGSLRMYHCLKSSAVRSEPQSAMRHVRIMDSDGVRSEVCAEYSEDVARRSLLQHFTPGAQHLVFACPGRTADIVAQLLAAADGDADRAARAWSRHQLQPWPPTAADASAAVVDWENIRHQSRLCARRYTRAIVDGFGEGAFGVRLPFAGAPLGDRIRMAYGDAVGSDEAADNGDGRRGGGRTGAPGRVQPGMASAARGGDSLARARRIPNVPVGSTTGIARLFEQHFLATVYREHAAALFADRPQLDARTTGSVSVNRDGDILYVDVRGARCEIVQQRQGRRHRSSRGALADRGQYFIVNLRRGVAYQKCRKASCRGVAGERPGTSACGARLPLPDTLRAALEAEIAQLALPGAAPADTFAPLSRAAPAAPAAPPPAKRRRLEPSDGGSSGTSSSGSSGTSSSGSSGTSSGGGGGNSSPKTKDAPPTAVRRARRISQRGAPPPAPPRGDNSQ